MRELSGKLAKNFADVGDERLDVQRMIEEVFDGPFGKRVGGLTVNFAPFFQATECGGEGIVRIEREKNEFVEMVFLFDLGDGVFGQWFPVAHSGDGYGIDVGFESGDEFGALAFGEDTNGGAAANLAVTLSDRNATFLGDVTG